MNVAKILSVVFEGDLGDTGDISSKVLEGRNYSSRSPVPLVSPSDGPWGTYPGPEGDNESHTDQTLKGSCPPAPHVPCILVDGETFEERAAIIEHDAGLTRQEAETLAAREQGFADADSLHGEMVRRWAAEIERLAKLSAVSPECAAALKRARAFIDQGWALQAARLGWGETELFGVCPRKPWARLDRKGVAFSGAAQAVTADAVAYVGNLRRYRAQVNNGGGAIPIWELTGETGE
jgi:hypothetical protein